MKLEYAVFGGVVVVGLAVLWRLSSATGNAVKAVGTAINPTDGKNIAHSSVNAVGAAISGDENWTIGTKLAELTTPDSQKYLGYPSRFEVPTKTWFVLVDGKWIVDEYQTAQARKPAAVKPVGVLK